METKSQSFLINSQERLTNKLKTKISKTFYYKCSRCKIDSLGDSMCPCPRGGCEAKLAGKIVTKTTTTFIKIKNFIYK
jgi:hypothetical protein